MAITPSTVFRLAHGYMRIQRRLRLSSRQTTVNTKTVESMSAPCACHAPSHEQVSRGRSVETHLRQMTKNVSNAARVPKMQVALLAMASSRVTVIQVR